jgi:signal recognition particle receptor subunit alpha
MISYTAVFTKSGIVLWFRTLSKVHGNPVEELIGDVLIEEKSAEKCAVVGNYELKWEFQNVNGVELVFVIVYAKLLTLPYVDSLLHRMKLV